MSNDISAGISTAKIHPVLKELLATYQSEKAESQRDSDARFSEYWECACQTIYDVAAAFNIPLEEKSSTRRPHTPDGLAPLGSVDVQNKFK